MNEFSVRPCFLRISDSKSNFSLNWKTTMQESFSPSICLPASSCLLFTFFQLQLSLPKQCTHQYTWAHLLRPGNVLQQHPFNEILRATICPGCLPKQKESGMQRPGKEDWYGEIEWKQKKNKKGLVTEMLVSLIGMFGGEKDTSFTMYTIYAMESCRTVENLFFVSKRSQTVWN